MRAQWFVLLAIAWSGCEGSNSESTFDEEDWTAAILGDDGSYESEDNEVFLRANPGEPWSERMEALLRQYVDKDKDGYLTVDELAEWTRSAQEKRERVSTRDDMQRLDLDHDGSVEWEEWRELGLQYQHGLVPKDVKEQQKLLKLQFEKADVDNDGRVQLIELAALTKGVTTDDQLRLFAEGMIAAHDEDEDGKVTLEEFIHTASRDLLDVLPADILPSKNDDDSNSSSQSSDLTEEQREYLKHDFDAADTNRDGVLDIQEIFDLLKEESAEVRQHEEQSDLQDVEERVQTFIDDVMVVLGEASGMLPPFEPKSDTRDDADTLTAETSAEEAAHVAAARQLKIPINATVSMWSPLANSPLTADGIMLREPELFDLLEVSKYVVSSATEGGGYGYDGDVGRRHHLVDDSNVGVTPQQKEAAHDEL